MSNWLNFDKKVFVKISFTGKKRVEVAELLKYLVSVNVACTSFLNSLLIKQKTNCGKIDCFTYNCMKSLLLPLSWLTDSVTISNRSKTNHDDNSSTSSNDDNYQQHDEYDRLL